MGRTGSPAPALHGSLRPPPTSASSCANLDTPPLLVAGAWGQAWGGDPKGRRAVRRQVPGAERAPPRARVTVSAAPASARSCKAHWEGCEQALCGADGPSARVQAQWLRFYPSLSKSLRHRARKSGGRKKVWSDQCAHTEGKGRKWATRWEGWTTHSARVTIQVIAGVKERRDGD